MALMLRILLTGASGFAGAALLPRLLEQGHEVRALARDRERVRCALAYTGAAELGDVDLRIGDALSGAGDRSGDARDRGRLLPDPLDGAPPADRRGSPSPARERASADTFAQAARAAGVRRIVYLGGLMPKRRGRPSTHLTSRYAVERILLEAVPESVALRASIVIGARSRSFRFLVRLVERMPVLALPAWRRVPHATDRRARCGRDARRCASVEAGGRTLDIGGPDVLSYGEIVKRSHR